MKLKLPLHLVTALAAGLTVNLAPAQNPAAGPVPSGPQIDGLFRKVILDADAEIETVPPKGAVF